LMHPVKLESLPIGDSQSAVAVLLAEIEFAQELGRGHLPPGDAAADHEDEVLVAAAAGVAVVLLIGAVKLQQLDVVAVERGGILGQLPGDRAAEIAARLFDAFRFAEFTLVGHLSDSLEEIIGRQLPANRTPKRDAGSTATCDGQLTTV